jgi:succinate dehydrogenase / fumarate reductase, cytochrome b subunit
MRIISRPVFLNLLYIEMPVGAITSIGHRISGVVLALGLPGALYILALSLRSEQGFKAALEDLGSLPVKATAVLLAWALSHHLLAGVRHLLSDINVGSPLSIARKTAYVVNIAAVSIAVCILGLLL